MNDKQLIHARGGIRPVARQLGHRNHTTVQGWYERGRIPTQAQRDEVVSLNVVVEQDQTA